MLHTVALDAQLTLGTATGIGEYIRGLTRGFVADDLRLRQLRASWCDPWRFDRRVLWDQCVLPLQTGRADLVHCTAGTMPLLSYKPVVVTVHDVAWLRVQQHTRAYARAYFGALMLRAYARAVRIITVSHFSRIELLSLTNIDPERVTVIYNGVDEDYAAVVRRPRTEKRYILAVGTVEARKNLALLIEALALMRDRETEILAVGPPTPYLQYCRNLSVERGVAARVRFAGYVERGQLLDYYAQAAVAAVPSTYEGFGYGAAQALVAGVPLLVADCASLPEIVEDAATTASPLDPQQWADELDAVLAEPAAYEERAAAYRAHAEERFSWSSAARQTANVYRAAIAEKSFG